MFWVRRVVAGASISVIGVVGSGCGGAPSRSGLVAKLRQENGLTAKQATCVANGLYDGVPRSGSHAAIRPLTTKELKTVAKPDNAGKVPADVVQLLRDVVGACLPTNVQPVSP
jgi:hypothetical protein